MTSQFWFESTCLYEIGINVVAGVILNGISKFHSNFQDLDTH